MIPAACIAPMLLPVYSLRQGKPLWRAEEDITPGAVRELGLVELMVQARRCFRYSPLGANRRWVREYIIRPVTQSLRAQAHTHAYTVQAYTQTSTHIHIHKHRCETGSCA